MKRIQSLKRKKKITRCKFTGYNDRSVFQSENLFYVLRREIKILLPISAWFESKNN